MTIEDIQALTERGYSILEDIAKTDPHLFVNAKTYILKQEMKTQLKASTVPDEELFDKGRAWTPKKSLDGITTTIVGPGEDYKNAKYLREALPDMTPADMADPKVLASINCFHLQKYVDKRWQSSRTAQSKEKDEKVRYVRAHWLAVQNVDIKESNAVARLWWLYEFANRAAKHSKQNADELLHAMANKATLYNSLVDYTYLMSSDKIRAAILDISTEIGLGNERNIKKTLGQLNRIAGGIGLDILSKKAIRDKVEGALPPK